jgi:hypothetical protein
MIASLNSDLQLYRDEKKRKFIHGKQKKLRKSMKKSEFKNSFSLQKIESDLRGSLGIFYDSMLMDLSTGNQFTRSHLLVTYVRKVIPRKVFNHSLPWFHAREKNFTLCRYVDVQTMTQHIANGQLYSELNRLDAQLQKCGIIPQKTMHGETPYTISDFGDPIRPKTKNLPSPSREFSHLFKESCFELFCWLQSGYITNDKALVAKYSNIYHFLSYHQLITCTQVQFIDFLEIRWQVKLSKILPKNDKYRESDYHVLHRLKLDFEKGIEKE